MAEEFERHIIDPEIKKDTQKKTLQERNKESEERYKAAEERIKKAEEVIKEMTEESDELKSKQPLSDEEKMRRIKEDEGLKLEEKPDDVE